MIRSALANRGLHGAAAPSSVAALFRTTRGRVLMAMLAVTAALIFLLRASDEMRDFEVYWQAGARAASAEPLYRPQDGHFVFKYLPMFAVLAIPMGLLPLPAARAIWFSVSCLLIVVVIALSLDLLPGKRKRPWVLAAIVLVVLGKFFGHELTLGQVNILMATVAASALLAMRRGREAVAGGLIALAIVIKPYGLLFVPWLLARRRLPSILTAASGLAVALLVPAVIYGWNDAIAEHRAWWEIVTSTTEPNLFVADNVSFASAFARIAGPGDVATRWAVAASVSLLAIVAAVFSVRRGVRFPDGLEGALLLTVIPLLSPQGWDYVFLLSAPAVAYLANYEDDLPSALRVLTIVALAAIGLSLFDVMGRSAYRAFMEASMITWLYLVVIAALVTLRLRKIA